MSDVATVHTENDNLRKIRARLLQWEAKDNPLAALSQQQQDYLDELTNAWQDEELNELHKTTATPLASSITVTMAVPSSTKSKITEKAVESKQSLQELWQREPIETTKDFVLWYERVREEMQIHEDAAAYSYLEQLELRNKECLSMLEQVDKAMHRLDKLSEEYEFVSQKTSALNNASEQLIEEQEKLQNIADEIKRRLHYFNQVEMLQQRLQSPTLSVASEAFRDCMNRIDECLQYLRENPKFKDSDAYTVKYKHCLARAVTLIKSYTSSVMAQATEATLHHPKQTTISTEAQAGEKALTPKVNLPDTAFALYYGKYQMSAAKIKRVTALVEARLDHAPEYEQLLAEMQQTYLTERAALMSPAVSKAIEDLKSAHKNDHCSLMRSTCSFLVHVCQDEQRLYFQYFSLGSEQLTAYLEGLCTVLYDTMRPYIIHINHLETLAEICSILRIEMLEENVQQNPEALEAFASTVNQLLQDVQERLVFRAHLYLQSDILNYNPSPGDLAYPDKLEMMESIALSLQEPQNMRRYDSRASLVSSVSSAVETESVDTTYRIRNMNSPADLHGMWYPTVRRTLVCLSRLYRCVDRPIFQGLSQEALKLCIQSVSSAASKIAAAKNPIDGELFEIKHLLILREQIAPFRVDFTIKETSLDFSKVKTAAFGLLHKRKQLFSMNSNNALLEFLLDGTPQIKEHLLDSRKEVDRQLKSVCEHFIKDAVQMLIGPIVIFLEKAQNLLNNSGGSENANSKDNKINYALRQSVWASPQQISSHIQETQRLIKSKLPALQRSMQLYLSNRDTEFIIFRPIRNNIIQAFVKLENILSTNGYTADDMTITACPSGEQVSILLSSASILAAEGVVNFAATAAMRKLSTSSNEGVSTLTGSQNRKTSLDKLRYGPPESGTSNLQPMAHVPELPETGNLAASPASVSPLTTTSQEQQSLSSTQTVKDAN